MIGFVGARNGATVTRDSSLDDLKLAEPGANATKAGQSSTARPKITPQVPLASHHNVPRAIHDADDSFDKTATSAAPSTVMEHLAQEDGRNLLGEAPSHARPDVVDEYEDDVESYFTDEEADEEQESPEHSGPAAEATEAKPDGRNLGRISGDTYPETTSGRPSTVHDDDRVEPETATYPEAQRGQAATVLQHGAGTRLPHTSHVMHSLPHGQNRHQDLSRMRNNKSAPPRAEDILKDAGSGFAFAPKGAQTNRIQATATDQSKHHNDLPMAAGTTYHRHPALGNHAATKETRRQEKSQRVKLEHQQNVPAPVQQALRKQQPERVRYDAAREPEQSRPLFPQLQQTQYPGHREHSPSVRAVEVPRSEVASEVDHSNEDMRRESNVEPQHGIHDAALLDHNPPELYNMPYQEIKAAPFDFDPNAAQLDSLSTLQPEDSLNNKMNALLSMDTLAKQEYITSLGIEEWEQAGDWFLESFSRLTQRFKTARQEKRKIAREFEDEVEQRYESISKKRKLIAGAMDEMKESGGRVLQGTPKKGTQMTR